MNKNHQVNEYLYVVWWISKRERPEPIWASSPVLKLKFVQTPYFILCDVTVYGGRK